jgi:hypothetical protein
MTTVAPTKRGTGQKTTRRDRWWLLPAVTVASLTLFGIYTAVFVIVDKDYLYTKGGASLLSPFYSPDLKSWFGQSASGGGFPWAIFVVWMPLVFRASCYYYRKAYYRSFFLAPPACAVAGAARRKYSGETKFPLIVNNLHRFTFYIAVFVVGWLWYDAIKGFIYQTPSGEAFGIGLGNIIMVANCVMLSAYTFGCNSWRHLIGGKIDCFSCSANTRVRHGLWQKFSILNQSHQAWAWYSMFGVWFTDLYIRLASAGAFTDPHHIF